MTTYKPHGRYDYVCDIEDEHLECTTFVEFECMVDVEVIVSCGEISSTVTDVLVDGKSLFRGDEFSRMLAARVAAKAEAELENGGWLWDQVREAEGLHLSGHPNDPDTRWLQAAE